MGRQQAQNERARLLNPSGRKPIDQDGQVPALNTEHGISQDSSQTFDDAVENDRLRRLINRYVLPVMCLAYLIQALDKGTLGTASIMGWMEDVGTDSEGYAQTSTCFWIGVIIGEPIANQIIRKYSPAKFLGGSMLIWSGLVFLLALTLDIKRVMLIRGFLGFMESGFGPCLLTITTQWYTSSESTFVTSVWQSMFGVANLISYFLAFGFYHVQSKPWGMAGWQWMTIFISIMSLFSSFVVLMYLPSTPATVSWSSESDKQLLIKRTGFDRRMDDSKFDRKQFFEAIFDPVTWLLFILMTLQCMVCGGLSTFSALMINRGFGFDVFTSQILGFPLALEIIALYFFVAWLIKKTDETLLCLISLVVPNIIGTIFLIHTPPTISSRPYLMLALYAMQAFSAAGPSLNALLARNTAGSTKISIRYAIVYIGWGLGNGLAPQLFRNRWSPRYVETLKIHLGIYVIWVGTALILRRVLVRRKCKSKGNEVVGGTSDLTDRQDDRFQYSS